MLIHVVKPGDTVYSIVLEYGIPMSQLILDNGLETSSRLAVGIVDGADNLRIFVHCACDILSQRLSCDGQTVGVEKVLLVQLSHDSVHAARLVEIFHISRSCRCQVAQVRCLLTDWISKCNIKIKSHFMGDCRKMEHAVRRTAERHIHGQRI